MILVDSDVLIAHLCGVDAARQWMLRARQQSGRLSTSVVCLTEVAGGMRSDERRTLGRLLPSLQAFPVTERVAWRGAELMRAYRRSNVGIGLGDYLVAATAEVERLELATLNVRRFPMFKDLVAPFALDA